MDYSWLLTGAGAAVGGLVLAANLPTSWWMPDELATEEYLAEADLKVTDGTKATVKEAREVSSIKAKLDNRGIKLYAIVQEFFGVDDFKEYFDGEVFVDKKRVFYGPKERRMLLSGLLRPSAYISGFRAQKMVEGNLKGEGRILGGAFVIGPRGQGIILQDRNMDFGATVKVDGLLEAIERVNSAKST